MSEKEMFDLAVLGSGPGGYVAAIRASQLGLRTLVIEKDPLFGGTCLHVGCIPSKVFLYTAELMDTIAQAEQFGISVGSIRLDWQRMLKRKERVVRKLAGGVGYLLKKNKVETLSGYGRLAGPGTLEVETDQGRSAVKARNVIIATGSEPRSLPGITIDRQSILTNTEMLSLQAQPARLGVIGAGAVGAEFASMFASFGTKVTLLEILPTVLPLEDEEVSTTLAASFRKRGIEVLTETRVESVSHIGETVALRLTLPDGTNDERVVDKLLVAVGRKPRTDKIGLESVGIETEGGTIPVNEFMETSAAGIYAIGDVVKSQQLAHVASAEGILAAEKMAGHEVQPMRYQHMPGATYCAPEVASVGLTERAAVDRGYEVTVGKFPFSANSKATILGENEGFVKVVSEATYGELLGVHIIGPHATELIAEAVVALELEATAESLMHAIHAHPTLSEAVKEAAHGAAGSPLHI